MCKKCGEQDMSCLDGDIDYFKCTKYHECTSDLKSSDHCTRTYDVYNKNYNGNPVFNFCKCKDY